MGYAVLPVQISEISDTYSVYFSAFASSHLLRALFPSSDTSSPEFLKAHAAHTLEYWRSTTHQYTLKCIDGATGEIVGMALWDVYAQDREDEQEWRKKPEVGWLQGEERTRAEALLEPFWERKRRLVGGKAHIYYHVVAVSPEHQRRGIGRLLTDWGITLSESLSLPIYLESSPAAVRLYEATGFEELEEERIVHTKEETGEDEEVLVPIMVRVPEGWKNTSAREWVGKPRKDSHVTV